MVSTLARLGEGDLRALAAAIRVGTLAVPFSPSTLQRFVTQQASFEVAAELAELHGAGANRESLARCLELCADAAANRRPLEDRVQVVTTGPGMPGAANRDTLVVVQELFRGAQRSVLVAGYSVYEGRKVFRELADRMEELPELHTRLFLDIKRREDDGSPNGEIVRRFVTHFRTEHWPQGHRLPEVYYDPRSLGTNRKESAVLHAKCVVVDGTELFVSSANFTEAAQERNIELGLRVTSAALSGQVVRFFDGLVAGRVLMRVI